MEHLATSLALPVKPAVISYAQGRGGAERQIELFHFDDGSFKTELYLRRIQDRTGPKWHIPRNIGPDFIMHLTAERLVEKRNHRGVPEQIWFCGQQENHLGDCEKMRLVRGYLLASEFKPTPNPAETDAPTRPKDALQNKLGGLAFPTRGGWVHGWK